MSTSTIRVYRDKARKWRWQRIASNGQITATAHQGYTRKAHALRMAERVNAQPYRIVIE